jgi:hypothetical protein
MDAWTVASADIEAAGDLAPADQQSAADTSLFMHLASSIAETSCTTTAVVAHANCCGCYRQLPTAGCLMFICPAGARWQMLL